MDNNEHFHKCDSVIIILQQLIIITWSSTCHLSLRHWVLIGGNRYNGNRDKSWFQHYPFHVTVFERIISHCFISMTRRYQNIQDWLFKLTLTPQWRTVNKNWWNYGYFCNRSRKCHKLDFFNECPVMEILFTMVEENFEF